MTDREADISSKATLGFLQGSKLALIASLVYSPYVAKVEASKSGSSVLFSYFKVSSQLIVIPLHFAFIAGTR